MSSLLVAKSVACKLTEELALFKIANSDRMRFKK